MNSDFLLDNSDFLAAWMRCETHLRNYARRLCGNEHDADDLYTETFLRAASRWIPAQKVHCGWFATIMYRLFLDGKRSRHPTISLDAPAYEGATETLADLVPDEFDIESLLDDTAIAAAATETLMLECLQHLREQTESGIGQFTAEDIAFFLVYHRLEGARAALEMLANDSNILSPMSVFLAALVLSLTKEGFVTKGTKDVQRQLKSLVSSGDLTAFQVACMEALLGINSIRNLSILTGKPERTIEDAISAVEQAIRNHFASIVEQKPLSETTADQREIVRRADFDTAFEACLEGFFDADDNDAFTAVGKFRRLKRLLCFHRYYSVANSDLKWTMTQVAHHHEVAVGSVSGYVGEIEQEFCARFRKQFPGDLEALLTAWNRLSTLALSERATRFSHREQGILRCCGIAIPRPGSH